jgi:predicted transcriptional regulator
VGHAGARIETDTLTAQEARRAAVADRNRRTRSWLINEAVKNYLERLGEDEKRSSETLNALASVRGGRLVDGDKMLEWISAWGGKAEKKPPR